MKMTYSDVILLVAFLLFVLAGVNGECHMDFMQNTAFGLVALGLIGNKND